LCKALLLAAVLLLLAAALERSGVDPAVVDEVFMGNVCSANVGQVCSGCRESPACAGVRILMQHMRKQQLLSAAPQTAHSTVVAQGWYPSTM
jgi:acetyl-CoA acetyltransferase